MALPNPFRRLKAETSTVDELSAELGRLDRIRTDAQNALHDLGAKRPGLLVDGTDASLAKLDAELATASRALEQAEARIALITPEWQEADARETATRVDRERRERHAVAAKARAEAVKILASYEADAAALAAKLRRLGEIQQQILAANADLPEDAAPLSWVENFNGTDGTPAYTPEIDVWVSPEGHHLGSALPGQQPPAPGAKRKRVQGYGSIPGIPGRPHSPLADRVRLPRIKPFEDFWVGREAVGTPLSADAAAILRFHGVNR